MSIDFITLIFTEWKHLYRFISFLDIIQHNYKLWALLHHIMPAFLFWRSLLGIVSNNLSRRHTGQISTLDLAIFFYVANPSEFDRQYLTCHVADFDRWPRKSSDRSNKWGGANLSFAKDTYLCHALGQGCMIAHHQCKIPYKYKFLWCNAH